MQIKQTWYCENTCITSKWNLAQVTEDARKTIDVRFHFHTNIVENNRVQYFVSKDRSEVSFHKQGWN